MIYRSRGARTPNLETKWKHLVICTNTCTNRCTSVDLQCTCTITPVMILKWKYRFSSVSFQDKPGQEVICLPYETFKHLKTIMSYQDKSKTLNVSPSKTAEGQWKRETFPLLLCSSEKWAELWTLTLYGGDLTQWATELAFSKPIEWHIYQIQTGAFLHSFSPRIGQKVQVLRWESTKPHVFDS